MSNYKILVTGASGFIGGHLIEHLIKDGQPEKDIRLLIPHEESLKNLPSGLFEVVVGDIRNKEDVDKAVKGVDVIYHLAAKTIIPNGTYDYYKDTNVDGTKNLLNSAQKFNVKKFILFSSISVFGLPAWAGDILGFNEARPKKYSEPYGRTKLEAEKMVLDANKKWGMKYIIIRPTTVYGPRDTAGIFQLLKAIYYNVFFFIGNGKNKMDYVYVKDLVMAARNSEKSKISNEDFIIGSCKPITQIKLITIASRVLRKPTSKVHVPKFLALILAVCIERVSRMFNVKPLIFPDRVKVLTASCYYDCSKAQNLLHYKPSTSIDEGVRLTFNWIKLQGILK